MISPPFALFDSILERGKISPNFWCSSEYFEKANFRIEIEGKWIEVWEGDQLIFPAVSDRYPFQKEVIGEVSWSDFEESFFFVGHRVFLDYEYIYDPNSFLDLSGGKWKVFRKNLKKWPSLNPGWKYERLSGGSEEIFEVALDWAESLGEENIHDHELLLKYLEFGENKKGIRDGKGILRAVNIWDSNWKYINFRYCLCKSEPFLSEFARYLFYTDPEILERGKKVNDGGTLGRDSLKRFKDKLNPYRVRKVFSWDWSKQE
ncbi:MAG: hypothetical protein JRJ69_09475 [Deltaproteobacteria bacterium]|nr:hypothetical protein [Deltaproteobacteria bacterium]